MDLSTICSRMKPKGRLSEIQNADRYMERMDNIFQKRNKVTKSSTLTITNDCGDTGTVSEGQTADAPEASDDDDDGGDSDGEPARSRQQRPTITPALFAFTHLSQYVALNRTRIYSLIRDGTFPSPIKIGKSSRWQRHAIDKWIDTQARQTNLTAG